MAVPLAWLPDLPPLGKLENLVCPTQVPPFHLSKEIKLLSARELFLGPLIKVFHEAASVVRFSTSFPWDAISTAVFI